MIHPDLLAAQKLFFEPNGFRLAKLEEEGESEEYGAAYFEMDQRRIRFRVGKITPTKIGHFVTLWKRVGRGPISPYDCEDPFDFFIISVKTEGRFGQFVFPKTALIEQGIVSKEGKGGKLGIRVYAPWERPENRQAVKTQAWQGQFFLEIAPGRDLARLQELLRFSE